MRISNVQNFKRNEIISTNRKSSFQSKKPETVVKIAESPLSQRLIDRLGIDMTTEVGYKGEPNYTPAPASVGERLMNYFHKHMVDWATHVDTGKNVQKY